MIVKSQWLAKRGGKRLHLFPVVESNPDARRAECGETVPRGDIGTAETSTFCSACLLRAGSTVRRHQSTPVGAAA